MVLDRNTFANRSSDYRQALAALASCLHGRLIEPGDPEYDEARRVWNGSVDRHPALVVRAADVTDVLSAVNFARQQGSELAIRSGGHSLAGADTSNGGLVLDLSGMETMTIDLGRRCAAHRDAGMMFTAISGWEDPTEGPAHHAWVNAFWRAIRPYSAGVYVNFLEDESEERVREAYEPATYERLVAIKNRYDPTNVFHLNQNIAPTR